jgi:hypothetical protein
MKAVTVKGISGELLNLSPKELRDLCLRLARFRKENKELLTYLLFEAADEEAYIESVKNEIDIQFGKVNRNSYYFIKKGVRRILVNTRKFIRYSHNKKTEIDLLIYFCTKLKRFTPSIKGNTALRNLYLKLVAEIRKKLGSLHEDLLYDYEMELEALE